MDSRGWLQSSLATMVIRWEEELPLWMATTARHVPGGEGYTLQNDVNSWGLHWLELFSVVGIHFVWNDWNQGIKEGKNYSSLWMLWLLGI